MLLITKAVGALLSPPAVFLFLALLGLWLQLRWRYLGLGIASASVLALLILSLPITADFLLITLENSVPPLTATDEALRKQAGAIVVLGGGRAADTPEYGGDTISSATLERVRYGARLHRTTALPLLLSGGSAFGEPMPEATLMRDALTQDFHVDVRWAEERSRTTHENAIFTRPILDAADIHRVVLVTHAWHMPRAVLAFQQAGIDVIPAPTIYTDRNSTLTVLGFLPTGASLAKSNLALHEWLGMLWYRLAYGPPMKPAARTEPAARGGSDGQTLRAFEGTDGRRIGARGPRKIATGRIKSFAAEPAQTGRA